MKPRYLLWFWILTAGFCLSAGSCLLQSPTPPPYATSQSKENPKLDVPFEPSSAEVVKEMMEIAGVNKDDFVYDLGCGDGRIVITAARKAGARGVGVDLDPLRIRESKENAQKAGVADRVKFLQQDLFQADIRQATVVMLYLWPEVNLRLRPKLLRELKPGTRIVSHSHDMGNWEADRSITAINGHKVHFWVVPGNVSGTWKWDMVDEKEKERWVLRLRQDFQKVSGTLQAGPHQKPLKELELKGEWLRFVTDKETNGQIYPVHFSGRVKEHLLEGTVEETMTCGPFENSWRARRDPLTAVPLE